LFFKKHASFRGFHYINYYDEKRKRQRLTTKTNIKYLALKIRDEYFENLRRKKEEKINNNNTNNNNSNNNQYTFDDIALKFLEEKTRTCRESTVKNYKLFLKNITPFFTNKLLKNINKVILKGYENYRLMSGAKEQYLRGELVLLQSILNLAVEYGMIDINPFNSYKFRKQLKDYEPRDRFLTPEECQRLIKYSNELLQSLIIFLLNTGLRINEALNLLYTDMATDIKTNIPYITVRREIAKSKRERFIPLTKDAMEQIKRMKIRFPSSLFIFTDNRGNPYRTTPKKAFETAKRKANLSNIGGFHVLRHTAGSFWLQGVNYKGERTKPLRIEVISKLLGHNNTTLTETVYAKLDNEDIIKSLPEIEK
jgi:integrase